MAKVSV